jgi:sodium/potassium-transporting ATPase subunit alpha
MEPTQLQTEYKTRTIKVDEYLEKVEQKIPPELISIPDTVDSHLISIKDLFLELKCTEKGLSETEASQRLLKDGPNAIIPPKKNPLLKLLRYLFSGFGLILWPAAILCVLAWKPFGAPPDPTNLGLAVVLVIVILLQVKTPI